MGSEKYCVIMAGGIGSRFWPMSRASRPKQFLDILGTGKTFIRNTYERFLRIVPSENFLVVTNYDYKDIVLEEIPELSDNQVLCEPVGRNTAPCIAYAAFRLNAMSKDSIMIVTPSDHLILDPDKFTKSINESAEFIDEHPDAIMTIGIKPNHPNTGYGYIQVDHCCYSPNHEHEICKVKTFTEKPDMELAKAFLESGEFFWNSGIFIWKTKTILDELKLQLNDTYTLFDSISKYYNTAEEYAHIQKIYPECRGISVDFGIMEKANNVYVKCSDFGWSDIGTWGALYDYSEKDHMGNVVTSENSLYNTENCIIKVREDKLVVIDGLKDFIVADKDNVLMICPRENEQNIKSYIEEVKYKKGDRFI